MPPGAPLSVRAAIIAFLKRARTRCRPATVDRYEHAVAGIRFLHGHRAAASITAADLDSFRAARLKDGASLGTAALEERVYRHVLRLAGTGPAPETLARIRVSVSPPKFVEPADVHRLLDVVQPGMRFRRLAPFIHLAAFAGLRGDEIAHLRWNEIDLHRSAIHVQAYAFTPPDFHHSSRVTWEPKTSKSTRLVPMDEDLHDWLVSWRLEQQRTRRSWLVAPCFLKDGRSAPYTLRQRLKLLASLFAFAGVDIPADARHRLHALRGTYATNLLRAGADLKTVSELLGHDNVGTTSLYLHTDTNAKRAAVRLLRPKFPAPAEVSPAAFAEAAAQEL